jgi:hypothetical protein
VPADEEALLTLRKVRNAAVRRLGVLREQQAKLGTLTPASVLIEIEDAQRGIAEIDQQLLVLEQPPPSQEVKQAIRDTHGTMIDFIAAQVMLFGKRQADLEVEVGEVRKTQVAEREERPERQRVLDERLDKQDEDLKVIRQRQREIRKWLVRIIVVVGILVGLRIWDVWHLIFG